MDKSLCHYGVLGMHWGVRRYQNKDGTLTPEGRKRREDLSEDELTKRSLMSKKTSSLSNEELRTLNNRLQLETTRRELSKKSILNGESFVGAVAISVASMLAVDYTKKYATAGANYLESKLIKYGSRGLSYVKNAFQR